MLFKDVLHTCGSKDIEINLYIDSYDPVNVVDFETARYEEIAFQEVLQIIPSIGNEEHPEPALAIVIADGDPVIPEITLPTPGSLKEYIAMLPGDVHAIIEEGEFTGNSLVQEFTIERKYPEIPLIKFSVTEIVTMIVIPK